MSQFFKQTTIHCGKCNEYAGTVKNKPKCFEVRVVCKGGHNIEITIDKKSGEVEVLTEELE